MSDGKSRTIVGPTTGEWQYRTSAAHKDELIFVHMGTGFAWFVKDYLFHEQRAEMWRALEGVLTFKLRRKEWDWAPERLSTRRKK